MNAALPSWVARQYVEYLQHLVRLAVGTGQFLGWIRYCLVALAGALIDVGLFCALVERGDMAAGSRIAGGH